MNDFRSVDLKVLELSVHSCIYGGFRGDKGYYSTIGVSPPLEPLYW